MVADTLGRLLSENNDFAVRRERLAGLSPQRLALWPSLAETGLLGTVFPEALGGFGGSARDIAVVLYELGRSLAVEPYLGILASARVLQAVVGHEPGQGEIDAIIGGERIIVPAFGEGFDPFALPKVSAATDGNLFRLSGVKPVVRYADVAHGFIVSAMLPDGAGIGCFLVERDAHGVKIDPLRLMDSAGAGTLYLDNATGTVLLAGAQAQRAITDAMEWTIVGMAAEAAGILDALNEATRDYLRTRVQFGAPIGTFQALQHRAADMFIVAEEAVVAADAILGFLDSDPGDQRSARVSALKVVIDNAGRKVGHEAVQLHGGVGVSDELIVSHYMRRLATIRAEWGGVEIHRSRYGALAA